MDTTPASPCDDFFQYACGGWIKANPIPDDQSSWTRFNALAEDNLKVERDILERDATNPPADEAYAKVLGDYYGACMDEAGVEKDGLRALAPEMKRIEGVHDVASLSRKSSATSAMGAYPYFDVGAEQDLKDATQQIGAVDQRGLGMPDRDYYLKDDPRTLAIRDKYIAHVERTFALLGDKPEVAKKEAAAVFALEKALAADQISRVEHRDPIKTYHRMTAAELAKLAPCCSSGTPTSRRSARRRSRPSTSASRTTSPRSTGTSRARRRRPGRTRSAPTSASPSSALTPTPCRRSSSTRRSRSGRSSPGRRRTTLAGAAASWRSTRGWARRSRSRS